MNYIISDMAMKASDERLFPASRHRSARIHKKLVKRHGGEFRMAHLIREHMAMVDGDEPVGGFSKRVEIDETFIGGHVEGGQGGKGKKVVIGMMEHDGKIITEVVPNRQSGNLVPVIRKHVKPHSEVHTDELIAYGGLGTMNGYWHKTVNHSREEYVSSTGTTVNGIEGFWSQLKRTISGTHIHVSGKHLRKYAKEAEYRFNRRDCPEMMLSELLGTFGPLPEPRD